VLSVAFAGPPELCVACYILALQRMLHVVCQALICVGAAVSTVSDVEASLTGVLSSVLMVSATAANQIVRRRLCCSASADTSTAYPLLQRTAAPQSRTRKPLN
jgi:hypothetical protein